jgi:peroxiredoxin family protein
LRCPFLLFKVKVYITFWGTKAIPKNIKKLPLTDVFFGPKRAPHFETYPNVNLKECAK